MAGRSYTLPPIGVIVKKHDIFHVAFLGPFFSASFFLQCLLYGCPLSKKSNKVY